MKKPKLTPEQKAVQIVIELSDCHNGLLDIKWENKDHYSNCFNGHSYDNCVMRAFDKVRGTSDFADLENVCPSCKLAVMNYEKAKELRKKAGNAKRRIHTLAPKLRAK